MPPVVRTPPKKMKTGFCGVGSCEGTKPKSASGKPMKTCEYWETCSCSCHEQITKMFEMVEQPRIVVSNPEYTTPVSPYKMPTLEEWRAEHPDRSTQPGPDAPPAIKSPATDATPAIVTRSFTATPTGRAARGELESQVNEICLEWVLEKYPWPCTPAFVSDKIAKKYGISAPSTGAIDAVYKRWEKMGYAVIGKKPTRFSEFTPDGINLGLDGMKAKIKRSQDIAKSKQSRGVR